MKRFCFTVDDNLRFLKELTEKTPQSIFDHPYLALYRRLHEEYGLKIQLNLFYEMKDFDLSMMTDRYREEFSANADWLKFSFHSRIENIKPYMESGYDEVYRDCTDVHREILRFAGEKSLAKTTTIHYCLATPEGLAALKDCDVKGLLGLYGRADRPRSSYQTSFEDGEKIRRGEVVLDDGVIYAGIDIVTNDYSLEDNRRLLGQLLGRERINVMIHEQYFYPDYVRHLPYFEQLLHQTFVTLRENGYVSAFFEEFL